MDFRKVKPSKNFVDQSSSQRSLLSALLDPYAPWPDGSFDWDKKELGRLGKGEDAINLLRDRMKKLFWDNFLMEGNRPRRNFDFHKEEFDTHSNQRKRSQGSSYDNY